MFVVSRIVLLICVMCEVRVDRDSCERTDINAELFARLLHFARFQ